MNVHGSLGHNRPDYAVVVREQMDEALAPFVARRDEFIAKADSYVVRDREDARKVVDYLGMVADVWAMIEAERKAVSNPHHDAQRRAIAIAEEFWRGVQQAAQTVQDKLTAYNDKRKAVMEEQQAEQRAMSQPSAPDAPRAAIDYASGRPAEGAPATTRAPRPQAIVGDYGYKQVEVTKTYVEVVDVRLVPDSILNSDPVKEAIGKVALAIVKATKQKHLDGCKIHLAGEHTIRS